MNHTRPYRFGFNSQEKDDEVSGAGNSYTAEFWQYDPRLGRRFNLDPKGHPAISSYACFDNNPIFFVDPNGDSTLYYDSKGTLLHTSYDDLENAVTIIDDNKLEAFNNWLLQAKDKTPEQKKRELSNHHVNLFWRKHYGKSYVVDEYRKFYNDHSKDAEKSASIEQADGKGPLINEWGSTLSNQNGYIRITGSPRQGDPEGVNSGRYDPENSTRIHTHPNEGRKFIYTTEPNVIRTFNPGALGLSDDLSNAQGSVNPGFLRIVVAKDLIFFYNGDGIKITFKGFK